MRSLLVSVLVIAAACAQAGTVTWGNQQVGVVDVPVADLTTTALPLADVRALDLKGQALFVGDMLDRWISLYDQLSTPTLYQGNRFASWAQHIRWRAEKEGVTDAVLAECAKFKAELSKQIKGK